MGVRVLGTGQQQGAQGRGSGGDCQCGAAVDSDSEFSVYWAKLPPLRTSQLNHSSTSGMCVNILILAVVAQQDIHGLIGIDAVFCSKRCWVRIVSG